MTVLKDPDHCAESGELHEPVQHKRLDWNEQTAGKEEEGHEPAEADPDPDPGDPRELEVRAARH